MRDLVMVVLSLVFLSSSLFNTLHAVLTYWWFGIFRPHDYIYGSALQDMRAPLVAVVILVLTAAARGIFPRLNNYIGALMAMFLAVLAVATLTAGCTGSSVLRVYGLLDITLLFYVCLLTAEIVNDRRKVSILVALLAACIAFHAGKEGINALTSGSHKGAGGTFTGLFSGSNAYALGSGMLLFWLLFCLQSLRTAIVPPCAQTIEAQSSKEIAKGQLLLKAAHVGKPLIFLACVGTFYNVVNLESRGAFLATVLGLTVWMLLHPKRFRMIIFSGLALIGVLSVYSVSDSYKERIASAFAPNEELDASAAARPYFWGLASEMAQTMPLGVGPGCYASYYDSFDVTAGRHGRARSVHSSHFEVLAEGGYVGLILWGGLFLFAFTKLLRVRRYAMRVVSDPEDKQFFVAISSCLLGTLTVFAVGGAFYEVAYNDVLWLSFALTISVERLFLKSTMVQAVEAKRAGVTTKYDV